MGGRAFLGGAPLTGWHSPPQNPLLEGLQELLQDTLSPGRVLQASQWLSCTG